MYTQLILIGFRCETTHHDGALGVGPWINLDKADEPNERFVAGVDFEFNADTIDDCLVCGQRPVTTWSFRNHSPT